MDYNDIINTIQEVDCTPLIDNAIILETECITDKPFNHYTLNKENTTTIKEIILTKEILNNSIVNKKEEAKKRYKEKLIEFATVITANFNKNDLKIFYKNMSDLKLNQKASLRDITDNTAGKYLVFENEIVVIKDEYINSLYHELFHVSSTITDKPKVFSGFMQGNIDTKTSIANSINEGYTELLTKRYFESTAKNVYLYEVTMVKKLEEIIGKDKMESLYLNANLLGLINELKKYNTNENIMEFINKFDFVSEHLILKDKTSDLDRKIQEAIEYVSYFLINAYANKLKLYVDNNLISSTEQTESLLTYTKTFHQRYGTANKSYSLFPNIDINELLISNSYNENEAGFSK